MASMNRGFTRYYSRPTRQHTHMELADGLKTCMMAALKEWKEKNEVRINKAQQANDASMGILST